MHLDMDAFFASVEQVRNPALAGKPVIVGAGVIASCSYEARRFGLHAGQSLAEALRRCPQALVLDGNRHIYDAFARRVWDICSDFTPDMETLLDDAYLDFSGTERLHGPIKPMAERLKKRIQTETGLTVTLGLSTSRTVSRIATSCDKPDGLLIVNPGEEQAFMSALRIEKLPGVGHVAADLLARMNIRTIGQLTALSRDTLQLLFGANGLALFERAHGHDSHVIHPREIPRSISRETTFHRETADPDEIEATLYYLAERAMNTLRDLGLLTATVTTKLRYADFQSEAASRTLPEHSDLDTEVFALARNTLRRLYTRRANLRSIGIRLSNFRRANRTQPSLFDDRDRRRQGDLYRTLDEVRHRYGYGAIVAGRTLELLERMSRDDYGFVLRTPSITK